MLNSDLHETLEQGVPWSLICFSGIIWRGIVQRWSGFDELLVGIDKLKMNYCDSRERCVEEFMRAGHIWWYWRFWRSSRSTLRLWNNETLNPVPNAPLGNQPLHFQQNCNHWSIFSWSRSAWYVAMFLRTTALARTCRSHHCWLHVHTTPERVRTFWFVPQWHFVNITEKTMAERFKTSVWIFEETLFQFICHGYLQWFLSLRQTLDAQTLGSEDSPSNTTGGCHCIQLSHYTEAGLWNSKAINRFLQHHASFLFQRCKNWTSRISTMEIRKVQHDDGNPQDAGRRLANYRQQVWRRTRAEKISSWN